MWLIEAIDRRGDALFAGDVQLCDRIDLVDWQGPEQHLFHCDYCGGDDLQGGWVVARRTGRQVVWMPVFDKLTVGDDVWLREEYAPPWFMRRHGIPVIAHARLAAAVRGFPRLDALPPLTRREAALALQYESIEMLAALPEPAAVNRPWVISVSEPSHDDTLDLLDDLLRRWSADRRPVVLAERRGAGDVLGRSRLRPRVASARASPRPRAAPFRTRAGRRPRRRRRMISGTRTRCRPGARRPCRSSRPRS
jgi:hypothetical protein